MPTVEVPLGKGRGECRVRGARAFLLLGPILLGTVSAASADSSPGRPVGLARQLSAGVGVEVKGRPLTDGSFLAERIEVARNEGVGEQLRGIVEAVDSQARSLRVLGFTVQVGPETRLSRDPEQPAVFEDLTSGLRVKVDVRRSAGGTFVAKKIRIRENQYPEQKIVGPIEAVARSGVGLGVLWVLGRPVIVNGATDLVAENGPSRPAVSVGFGAVDEEDLLITGRNQIGSHLALLGEARLRGEVVPGLFGIAGLLAEFGTLLAYVEALGEHEHTFPRESGSHEEESGSVRGGQAYLGLSSFPAPGLSLVVGRQKFYENRRWYYDNKNLDAVRLFGDYGPVAFQASISRDLFDETRNPRDRDTTNRIAEVRWDLNQNVELHAFYLDREDRTELRNSPKILGLRILGDPGAYLEFWADLAGEGGTRGGLDSLTGEVIVREVRAHALDVGLIYRPRVAWDPSVTASFALGSGDDELALPPGQKPRGADGTFRQSGLQRNRGSLNGVVSFHYYGEALDPELTNLRIQTLGGGLRPVRTVSLDLLFHRYRQDMASTRLENTELGVDPMGLDPRLGSEWDLVVGYEPLKELEFRLTGGYFRPGQAFPDSAGPMTVATFQAKFRF